VINFRYHVVSITSVFLALAIGLVLGTAALNGPVADNIQGQVSSLRKTNGQLRDQVDEMQNRAQSQDQFVREVAPALLANRLANRTVALVSAPGATGQDVDGVAQTLQRAGAQVTGRVALDDSFTDPARDDELQDLATRVVPAGVSLPNDNKGIETASALLATVLVENPVTVSAANRTTILTAYAGLVSVQGDLAAPAAALVVVTGPPSADADADARNVAVLSTLRAFDGVARYLVAAAPSAGGAGNPVAAVRDDSELAKTISTVDGVSLAEGQVVTAMALAEQFSGRTGHYGTGNGATARVPSLG
jgi:hypothetical protein